MCAAAFPGLLKANAELPGGARHALLSSRRIALCADVPLGDPEVDIERRVRESCAGFTVAWAGGPGHPTDGGDRDVPFGSSDADRAGACDARALLSAGRWPFREPEAGLVVELEGGRASRQATVQQVGQGLLVCTELGGWPSASGVCQDALSVFLLSACGALRFGRAAMRSGDGGGMAIRYEVLLGPFPCTAEVDHALSSLSVAWRVCGREVKALHDERTASVYLAMQGYSSPHSQQLPEGRKESRG
jgi:hypothetical protein